MILRWLLLVLLITSSYGVNNTVTKYVKQLESMGADKQELIRSIYKSAEPYDLGYSLVAIAWKESNLGEWMINITDGKHGSFGLYHIRLDYALVRNKITSSWDKSRYAEKLLYDFNVSTAEAISLLIYWYNYHKSSPDRWKRTYGSYNGGFKVSKQSKAYADDIGYRIQALRIYIKKYHKDLLK